MKIAGYFQASLASKEQRGCVSFGSAPRCRETGRLYG
jgi:hypothetical protein